MDIVLYLRRNIYGTWDEPTGQEHEREMNEWNIMENNRYLLGYNHCANPDLWPSIDLFCSAAATVKAVYSLEPRMSHPHSFDSFVVDELDWIGKKVHTSLRSDFARFGLWTHPSKTFAKNSNPAANDKEMSMNFRAKCVNKIPSAQ